MAFSIDTTSIGEIRLQISVNVTTSLNRIVTHSNTFEQRSVNIIVLHAPFLILKRGTDASRDE